MRLLSLIKLSTAATCPVLLFSLPKVDSRPVTLSVSPTPNRETTQPTPRFASIATTASVPAIAPLRPIAVPQFSPSPTLSPRLFSRVQPSIAPTITALNRSDSEWNRIVERSLPASLLQQRNVSSVRTTPKPIRTSTPKSAPKFKQEQRPVKPESLPDVTTIETPYVLGIGDTIRITAVNVPEFSSDQQVGMDGSILLPVVGRIQIAGSTLPEAESKIANSLARELRRPRILMTVLKSRPLRIGIAGEIKQPGFYMIAPDTIQVPSIVQAIQTAGGVTLSANLQNIEIRRRDRTKGMQRIRVNLSDLMQAGDLSQNLALRDGDSIYIPAADEIDPTVAGQIADTNLASTGQTINIALVGEVTRPGAYKLESGKEFGNRATLTQAIQQAGGITSQADLRQIQIRRMTRNRQPRLITVDMMKLVRDGDLNQDVLLQSGDTIRLVRAPEMTAEDLIQQGTANLSPSAIRVNVVGEVKGAGALQISPGSTLNQAILAAGGLERRAAKSVELIRLNPNGTVTRRSIQIDLSRGIDPNNNPVLWNNDVIVVGRSGFTKFTDGLSDILSPIFRLLPLQILF